MVNLQDFIENTTFAKKLKVDELLFAEFSCPLDGARANLWWHNNFFAHILTGQAFLKTPKREYTLTAGSSVFAKKGSIVTVNSPGYHEFCELLIFIPDDFIKTVVKKYQVPLIQQDSDDGSDTIIPLANDDVLLIYFQSLLTHLHQPTPPLETLLKLKFEELLLHTLSNNSYQPVTAYFSEICKSAKPSIKEIMEENFTNNLSLDEFARLCARSLSAFKKDFTTVYKTTPGKWLMEKRLAYARYLLENFDYSIDEICMDSGFEDTTHFTRTFKNKYNLPPGKFKTESQAPHFPKTLQQGL
jgi:AraC-like DNA-binding protein